MLSQCPVAKPPVMAPPDKEAWWKQYLPTALIHFLAVECLHVYLAMLSWWSLVVDVNVKVAMMLHKVDVSPYARFYSNLYFWGSTREAIINSSTVVLPAQTIMTYQTDVPWLILNWVFMMGAIVLLLYVLGCFMMQGPFWSFEDGSYIHFTWRIVRSTTYMSCVSVMTVSAVLLPLLWIVQVFLYTKGQMYSNNLKVFVHSWKSGLLLVLALVKLGSFRMIPYWHTRRSSDPVQSVSLRRRPLQMFLSANASLGPKLLDALWAAENGDLRRLQASLKDPAAADGFLAACKREQRSYGATRASDAARSSNMEHGGD